jgi:hypothetical protein
MAELDDELIIITRGEKATFDIFLEKKNSFPRPVDLTNFDAFKVCLPLDAGGFLEITDTVNANGSIVTQTGSPLLGQLNVVVGSADSLLLKGGFGQDIDVEWDNVATPNPKRKRINKALNVEEFCGD